MDLRAFSFSLPYFYDKYKALNYSNAFYLLSRLAGPFHNLSVARRLGGQTLTPQTPLAVFFFVPCAFA